jgi:hypothetical protein
MPSSPPSPMPASAPSPPAPRAAASGGPELEADWSRVVEEVMRKKPMLGAVLAQARAASVRDGEVGLVLTGNHFHREMLADVANRELVAQTIRRQIAGATRFTVSAEEGGGGGGGVASHPAVQAAMAEFDGEVVAVRPRLPEGEGQ